MLPLPVYFALLTLCSLYAWIRGGWPERIGAVIMLMGSLLTLAVVSPLGERYRSVEVGVLAVDLVGTTCFILLALRANRFWPIWAAAFLGLHVIGHLGRWYAGPDIGRSAYAIVMVLWSYICLAIIALGTFNHRRRLARTGADPDWSLST